jgi:hypothetical protein
MAAIDGTTLGATTPSSVAATTGSFSSTLGVTGAATFSSTVAGAFNGTLGATTPASVAATTGTFSGVVTANAGVVVDNFTLDGTTLALSSGDMTLDVAGDINLDSDTGYVLFKDAGTEHARIFQNNSGDVNISSQISDKDMKFLGNDGGVGFTALTLDMSEAGAATFSGTVTAVGNMQTNSAGGVSAGARDTKIGTNASSASVTWYDGVNVFATDGTYEIKNTSSNGLSLAPITGAATFSGNVSVNGATSPNSSLAILSDSGANAVEIRTRATGDDYAFINFNSTDASEALGAIGVHRTAAATASLIFYSNDGTAGVNEVGRFDANGKLGIGLSSPTGSLHTTVKDSGGSDVFVVAQNTTSNRIAGFKVLDESGTASLVMQYDNGGNVASISNPNNGSLGIYLGGTGAANLLDDYEEGTWTPIYVGYFGSLATAATSVAGYIAATYSSINLVYTTAATTTVVNAGNAIGSSTNIQGVAVYFT